MLLARADRRCREPLGREELAGELADSLGLDRVDLGDQTVERENLGVGDNRLPEPGHPRRGRLHPEHQPALQVLLGALQLLLGQVACGDVRDLVGGDRERLGEVVLARPDVDPDLAGVCVLREEAVDRVGEAALLADLLEEPGRGGAAEDRVEDRGGEPAAVGAREAGSREADVVLLGVLALEAPAGLRSLSERRADTRPLVAGLGALVDGPLDERHELVVVDAPGRGDHDVPGRVEGAVVAAQGPAADARDHLGGADDRPAEGVTAEDRLADQVVDELLRGVLVHCDLLEHDLALGVEVVEAR